MTTSMPAYTSYDYDIGYEPMSYVTSLAWFNIAKCARERMTEYCHDVKRWRGERRSFYTSLQMIDADSKWLLD